MLEHLTDRASRDAIPIEPIAEGGLERWLARQRAPVRSWIAANRFRRAVHDRKLERQAATEAAAERE